MRDREVRMIDMSVRSALIRVRWKESPVRREDSSADMTSSSPLGLAVRLGYPPTRRQRSHQARREHCLPGERRPNRRLEIDAGASLQDVAHGPALECCGHDDRVINDREHNDGDLGTRRQYLPRCLDPTLAGHHDIEHYNVRSEGPSQLHRLGAIPCLANHVEGWRKQALERRQHRARIVDQQDSGGSRPVHPGSPG